MTVKEAAQKWSLQESTIQELCTNERINGVKKINGEFIIPNDAPKPSEETISEFTKHTEKTSLLSTISALVIGFALCLWGGAWILGDHLFFGAILIFIGAVICTLFIEPYFPKIKAEVILCAVMVISIFISIPLFGSGGGSNERKWSDLSDVEKANAKWAYDAKKFIDSQGD